MNPIVEEAYTWLGTPHVNQAKVKGKGIDCGMLQPDGMPDLVREGAEPETIQAGVFGRYDDGSDSVVVRDGPAVSTHSRITCRYGQRPAYNYVECAHHRRYFAE